MPATSTRRRVALIACDRHRRIRLVASDAVVEAAAGAAATDRTLRGLALPYAADGRTSAGRVRASAGVVRWPADLRRVKVFTGHDRTRPVGYVTTLTETNDGLVAELHIAGTPDGDAALLEAREGTRDAMSVELEDVELDDDGELLAAELVAIALVPLPAFSDARIAAERDDDDDQDDQPPASAPPGAGGGRRPATRAAGAPAALTASRRRPQTLTLDQAAAQLAAQYVDGGRTAAALNAALANITPTSTGSANTSPPQWLGELWTPEYVQLDWANAISTATLTSMRLTGFKRVPPGPVISPYAGDKAPIPTDGALGFGPVDVTAHRHAVGADFDRIWMDFGDESVINTWLRLVSQDYAKKLDAAIGAAILAEATVVATPAVNVIEAVTVAAQTLKRAGASVSFVALASDLFGDYLSITTADAPWWLASTSAVDLAATPNGSNGNVNGIKIFESVALPDGTVTAGDRRAATQYTPRGNPFNVRAVDVADGGIDVGVFGYSAELINDPLGIVTVSVATIP
jgi:HK97 family phage prohead protease